MDHKNYRDILVVGATGYVGGRLVPELVNSGYNVRCVVRHPEGLRARKWEGVEILQGDVLKPETLLPAVKSVEVAYYLVHSMGSKQNFEDMDARGAQNFAEVARKAKIDRIIYLGGLAEDSEDLSPHLKSRQEVGRLLGETGIPVTELRASIIIGSGSASFEIIRDLANILPLMITPKWVRSQCEPIAIRNVIQYLIGCLKEERTTGKVLEIGGGEILSYANMLRIVADVMGKKITMIPVPVLTPSLSAYWLNLVTSVPMSIAYPLVEGLRNDSICTDHSIRHWIPLDLIPFREAVERALDRESGGLIKSRWTEASNQVSDSAEFSNKKTLSDVRQINSRCSPDRLFDIIQQIGGGVGWYYANWIWKLRGAIDHLFGGVGMRRGRRHPQNIRVGDAIDFWRVEQFEAGHLLKLRAEMKLPGKAWLEFKVYQNRQKETIFQQTALFVPNGWFGILYWYAVMPAHFFVFRNMARRIVSKAESS